jgi:DNA-binding protein HU-beta
LPLTQCFCSFIIRPTKVTSIYEQGQTEEGGSKQIKRRKDMNKGDLVNAVVTVVGKKKTAEEAVNCVLEAITGALKKEESVTLVGFGTFKVTKRAARTGRNPQTGKAIKIKAKKVPKFAAGKKLRDAVAAAKK